MRCFGVPAPYEERTPELRGVLADCDGVARGSALTPFPPSQPAQARAETARQHAPAEKNVATDAARDQESTAPWWELAAPVGVQTSTPRRLDGTHSGADRWAVVGETWKRFRSHLWLSAPSERRISRSKSGTPSRFPKTSFLMAGSFVEPRMADLVERLVPDELWVLFRRVVPPTEVIRPQGGGRRRAGDREALAAIIFVATSGCTWRQLPSVFGPSWQTVYRRFAQWSRARVWARLHRVILDELGARGELDWSRCAIDSVSLRAAKGGL
ncbi:hypothetical protein GCM10010347_65330 [Streptomyces cirratus]|uniref:Insertion element IS402-like domain-containing protein n=1 Tax=Streptomyces cirratus TaxID=68187 RepID=A0ABQ3F5H5_9ACTN|nr:hypothetical protein GCM10010347_65330 [Streptomyces cirratus]